MPFAGLTIALVTLFAGCQQQEAAPAKPQSTSPTSAEEPKAPRVVRVGSEAAYRPMEYVDDEGNIAGYDIDLMRAIAKEGGFEVKFENVAWDALFGMLSNGEIDLAISSVTITDERKKTMTFSDPYYRSGQRLVVHAKHKDKNLTLETMDGMNVGAQIGTTSSELVEKNFPKINLRTFDNVVFGLRDLDQGNLDGFVVDDPVGRFYAAQGDFINLVFVEKEYTSEDFGIVVKNGDPELLEAVNAGLKKVKESGVAEQLKDKWLR